MPYVVTAFTTLLINTSVFWCIVVQVQSGFPSARHLVKIWCWGPWNLKGSFTDVQKQFSHRFPFPTCAPEDLRSTSSKATLGYLFK